MNLVHNLLPYAFKVPFIFKPPFYAHVFQLVPSLQVFRRNFWTYFWSHGRYSDWLQAGRPRGRRSKPRRVKNFLFSTSSRPAVGSTQPPIQWVPGVKRSGREADHSSPGSAEVKKNVDLYNHSSIRLHGIVETTLPLPITFDLVHAHFEPRPFLSPSFYYLNDARWRVQIFKLLVMRFILISCHFFPLGSNIFFPQHRLLKHPQSPHKPMSKIIILCILIFMF
jgi:hypothetical protein